MGWAMLYMIVILKIPVAFLLWLVWWSIRQEPVQPEQEHSDDGGHGGGPHPRPRRPRPPRRGPHAEPPPRPPKRVRAAKRPVRFKV